MTEIAPTAPRLSKHTVLGWAFSQYINIRSLRIPKRPPQRMSLSADGNFSAQIEKDGSGVIIKLDGHEDRTGEYSSTKINFTTRGWLAAGAIRATQEQIPDDFSIRYEPRLPDREFELGVGGSLSIDEVFRSVRAAFNIVRADHGAFDSE